jgi:ATP-dependent Clp protease ATP-binding subunit ClpA
MFERFTDRARRVVVLAQEEARMLDHNYIGTEHLLLALIHEGEGVAAQALRALEVDLDTLRWEVEALVGRGQQPQRRGHIPFTPRAKKALEFALRESVQLGHHYIGTEHLLLGLLREDEGPTAQLLGQRGIELSVVRQEVIRLLHGYQGGEGRRRRRTPWARSAGDGVSLEDISRQLRVLSARLSAIEAKLGITESPARQRLRQIDAEIAKVRRQKESAIDERDFERAAVLRDAEKQLLSDRRVAESVWLADEASAEAVRMQGTSRVTSRPAPRPASKRGRRPGRMSVPGLSPAW